MLHCVYHPVEEFKVVEDDEKEELLKTGQWFDSPLKAKAYKEKCIEQIKKEDKQNDELQKKRRGRKPKNASE